ncbi:MAG: hypothetical protein P8Z80_11770 [Pseudolabrys sp.]
MLVIFAKSFMTAAGYRPTGLRAASPAEGRLLPKRKWLSWFGRS